MYCQLIDDAAGRTLVSVSEREIKALKGTKTVRAEAVGKALAEKAKAAGITEIIFDRGGRLYHGRVKALAEAARAAGLKF
jgi:large subunit ribosomal protein L18